MRITGPTWLDAMLAYYEEREKYNRLFERHRENPPRSQNRALLAAHKRMKEIQRVAFHLLAARHVQDNPNFTVRPLASK